MLDVCLVGTGGMMPLPRRWLTALMTRYNGSSLLIDCGEAFAASQALSSSADSFAVIGRTRVDNLAFFITAIWTLHMKTSE